MIDPERLLGALISKGFDSGRRRRKTSLGMGSMLSGGVKGAVGLGIIGVAIAAFEHFANRNSTAPQGTPPVPTAAPPPSGVAASIWPAVPPPPPGNYPRETPSEERKQTALLLIRAMIAAANADGTVDPEEKSAILGRLESAGVSSEERAFVMRELDAPPSIDSLLPAVKDPSTAREVYAASLLAVRVDTQAEKDYLHYLRLRLGLDDQIASRIEEELSA